MSPLSKKRGHHDLRILRFERTASTAAVRTRGDFGIIPSPYETYNGVKYFYLKNAQGDVTGLVNASGTQVVSYAYDPWGAPMSTGGTMASTLGAANPLRYRGYVLC